MMERSRQILRLSIAAALVSACTSGWSGMDPAPTPAPAPRPLFRVVESATGATVPFSDVVARGAMADVVFFGEQHDDPETHFVEFALLEGIGRQRPDVIVSLEMFERDVQPMLSDYLAGRMTEADFLAKSRPWERYATDYRPLVVLARARGWRVLASNVPRPIASLVSRAGLGALDTLPPAMSRRWAANALSCPNDAYFTRFAQAMTGHSAGGVADAGATAAMTQRFYEAQCVKDETMAESIHGALLGVSNPPPFAPPAGERLVVHFNGSFHSDYGQGTVERVKRRYPQSRRLIITAIPVPDPTSASLGAHGARADYVIFTRAPEKKPGG